ncbi:terminase small subunit [Pantoea agglomerans]|uniref:terminase small subunit n=1 Tax=Enterobacter agglomerans TaxID=549 RepID=UPI003C7AEE6D
MSKPDWRALQSQFAAAHASTGISPKAWCEQEGLNYSSARRYIKKPVKNSAQKSAQNKSAQKPSKSRTSQKPEPVGAAQKKAAHDPSTSSFCADLNAQEQIFVTAFLKTRDKYDAYKKAGYTGGDRAARMLHRKPNITRAINRGLEQLHKDAVLSGQEVLRHWHEIAIADPGEISQMRRCCCRHCWGERFLYQWRDIDEYDRAAEKAIAAGKPQPEYGGLGFMENDDPNPDCPRCAGEGVADVYLADTRDLTGPSRRLIAGVKKSKFGIEIMMRDQDAALKNLAAFHHLAVSEQERELRLLRLEHERLANEKLKAEIEAIRNGRKEGELVVVHNALQVPGAIQPTQDNGEGD